MKHLDVSELSNRELFAFLLSAVIPRPIAFASTIDKEGKVNLSPFSYFNVMSTRPPVMVFSPVSSVRTGINKDTYYNIKECPEVVINIVNYAMVDQVSLTSSPYPKGVNEFEKSGLTPIPSLKVKPPRVKESPVQFECKVIDIVSLGDHGGAGNIVLCEILAIHVNEAVLTEDGGKVDAYKLDAVARLGGDLYSRVTPESIFEIKKPVTEMGVGVDVMPEAIRVSPILSGSDLGKLGSITEIPNLSELDNFPEVKKKVKPLNGNNSEGYFYLAKELLSENHIKEAWLVLLESLER